MGTFYRRRLLGPAAIAARIIGIDPGLRVTGYAVLEYQSSLSDGRGSRPPGGAPLRMATPVARSRPASVGLPDLTKHRIRIVEAGVIRVASGRGLETRLQELKSSLDEILRERQPHLMALEQLYAHYQRTQPAILMGHARGVIMLAAADLGIPVVSYSATAVKKTVSGHGRAPKEQMQAAVCQHLGLTKTPEPHDVADALAIALCHLFTGHQTLPSQV